MNPNQTPQPPKGSSPTPNAGQPYQNPSPNNPYEFILNPAKPPRVRRMGLGKNNFAFTLGLIIGGSLLLMILVTLVINVFGPSTLSKTDLLDLAQTQEEMVRVSNDARINTVQQSTKNLAGTSYSTILTHQQQILTKLTELGIKKIKEKELGIKRNAETDQRLTTAKNSSTYDRVYTEILKEELTIYANVMKDYYAKAGSQEERDRFLDYFNDTQLLIGQIPYTQAVIEAANETD